VAPSDLCELLDLGVVALDKSGKVTVWNRWMEQRSLIPRAEALGRPFFEIFPEVAGGRLQIAVDGALQRAFPAVISNVLNRSPLPLYPKDAPPKAALDRIQQAISVVPIPDGANGFEGCLVEVNDVSSAVRREEHLRQVVKDRLEAQEALDQERRIFMSGPTVVFRRKASAGIPIEYVSRNVQDQLGHTAESLTSRHASFLELVHPDDIERITTALRTALREGREDFELEYRMVTARGDYKWFLEVAAVVRDANKQVTHVNGYVQDITARKQAEAEITRLAYHDPLTGLLNRNHVSQVLGQEVARAQRRGEFAAALFIDLDRFKSVNDTHGHQAGDVVLVASADRIRLELRREDVAARLGGDEFLVLLSGLGSDQEAAGARAVAVAERLRAAICTPVSMADLKLSVGCSIGVTVFPKAENPEADPLWEADTAMYIAKRRGSNEIELFHDDGGDVHAPELRAASSR